MGIVYKNPALIEVIVELHWELTPVAIPPGAGVDPFYEVVKADVSSRLSAAGYHSTQELAPPQVPREFLAWKPLLRFSPAPEVWPKVQIGPGMFSVHAATTATSTYRGWHAFQPAVAAALGIFFESFPNPDRLLKLKNVQLRYMNGFTSKHGFAPDGGFTSTYLGLSSVLPKEFLGLLGISSTSITTNSRSSFPVVSPPDSNLIIEVADGQINTVPGCVLQIAVEKQRNLVSAREPILDWLEEAHYLARKSFESLATKDLVDLMGPEEKE